MADGTLLGLFEVVEGLTSEGSSVDGGEGFVGVLCIVGAVGAFEGVFVADGVGVTENVFAGAEGSTFSLSSPYSFHSSTSSRSYGHYQHHSTYMAIISALPTPTIMPILTSPGNFLFPALLPHNIRAFSSVATSSARKGILLALSMVSSREVAVIMCEEPAVRDV